MYCRERCINTFSDFDLGEGLRKLGSRDGPNMRVSHLRPLVRGNSTCHSGYAYSACPRIAHFSIIRLTPAARSLLI